MRRGASMVARDPFSFSGLHLLLFGCVSQGLRLHGVLAQPRSARADGPASGDEQRLRALVGVGIGARTVLYFSPS